MDYNYFLELAVIPLNIILYIYIILRYTNMTPVNIAFKRFAFLVMLADFMDVITSIVVSSTGIYSIPVRYIFNTLDCALTTLSTHLSTISMLIQILRKQV